METTQDKIKYLQDDTNDLVKHIKKLKSAITKLRKIPADDIKGYENMGFMNNQWYWTGADVWAISLNNLDRRSKNSAINSLKFEIEMHQSSINHNLKEIEKLEYLLYSTPEPCYFND